MSGERLGAGPAQDGIGISVLYTSLERDGALAEIVSYLVLLTPPPSKPLEWPPIAASTAKRFA